MRFLHLRLKKSDGSDQAHGGMTIGYSKVPTVDSKLIVTYARCSNNDIYSKDRGRKICESRQANGIFRELTLPEGKDLYELLFEGANDHEKYVQENYARHG